jgi:hypothetical protein
MGDLWQSFGMGNKDARRREVKKPKKQTPKLAPAPVRREVHSVTPTTVNRPTDKP